MRIAIVSSKGGVGKTTVAIHLAAYLQRKAATVLIDGDSTRSAAGWAARGNGALPFQVIEAQDATPAAVRGFAHVVIDSAANPPADDLAQLAAVDLVVVPVTAEAMSLAATMNTVATLRELGAEFRTLLSITPPWPSHDADEARAYLREQKIPTFKGSIRRAVAFQKASLAGVTVDQVDDPRGDQAWADFAAIGREITT